MESIKEVLIRRDNMSAKEADDLIKQAKKELLERLENDEEADYICEEYFGLEPDYILDLMY